MKAKVCFLLGLLLACHSPAIAASPTESREKKAGRTAGILPDLFTTKPDIVGKVTDERGKPLAGVSVMVYTAGPKEGPGVICPSCYADCVKEATTDSDGAFVIRRVDRSLLFRLLLVSPDHQPRFVSKVDPYAGSLAVKMKDKPELPPDPEHRLQGRIIDPSGNPVLGAKISPNGITRGRGTRYGGRTGTEPLAVTDKNGRFLLRIWEPLDKINVEIEARDLASTNLLDLTTDKSWLIRMTEGATVTGRIVHNKNPLEGVDVTLSGKNRRSGIFAGFYSARTDSNGRFTFFNIPTAGEFLMAAKMSSVGHLGATVSRELSLKKEGETVAAGDLVVRPGLRFTGRVVLTDGKPAPSDARLFLGRDDAWDSQQPKLARDGTFDISNLPSASISFGVRIPGYRMSRDNPSLDRLNGGSVVGRIERDLLDFVVLMEPGGRLSQAEMEEDFDGDMQPRDKPLRSVSNAIVAGINR